MSLQTIGWRFPINNDGEDDQIAQPGIEDFRNTPIVSLAREICQNSLDAKDPLNHAAVEVEFKLVKLSCTEFPEIDEFKKHLSACAAYQPDSSKTQVFFSKALEVINEKTIPFLVISDFNTTGCRGISEKNSDWYKLTKAVGSSDKPGGLGSFGIGKFAPYANSDLRTVFYHTKNVDNEIAFQGVARLISHEWNNSITRGTGYFGQTAKNEPLVELISVPEFLKRNKPGTTIAVAGFQLNPNWEKKIIGATLESLFYAIFSEKLVVKAGRSVISKATLGKWIDELNQDPSSFGVSTYVAYYYKTLVTSDAEEFKDDDFKGKGRISLRLIVGRDCPKRVAIVRGSGMKIFDKGSFQTTLKFAGIFNAEGEEINRYLKSMEPQQHDQLVPNRADDPIEAEKFLRSLYKWINDRVREVAERQFSAEADIEGVSKFLPDDAEDIVKTDDADEILDPIEAADSIPLTFSSKVSLPKTIKVTGFPAMPDETELPSYFPENDEDLIYPPNPNPVPPEDVIPVSEVPGDGDAVSPGDGSKASPKGAPVPLSRSRSFGADRSNKTLVITFTPDISGNGLLSLSARGETMQAHIPIQYARSLDSGAALKITADGRVGPIKLSAGKDCRVEVGLSKPSRYAMEVIVHAD